MDDLNNPQTRQNALKDRLELGVPLIAAAIADELDVSLDTVRRDLIALEQQGLVRRTRGGALPVTNPAPPYLNRVEEPNPMIGRLAERAARLIPNRGTIFLDGGTTMNGIAARLAETFTGLIVTPAPSVALAAFGRGARVHLIGGELCREGAMATGGDAERTVARFAADVCFLGACGLWQDFGLSAEDAGEAGVKRAMSLASGKTVIVTTANKLVQNGRHKVLDLSEIDILVTAANQAALNPLIEAGIEVLNV